MQTNFIQVKLMVLSGDTIIGWVEVVSTPASWFRFIDLGPELVLRTHPHHNSAKISIRSSSIIAIGEHE